MFSLSMNLTPKRFMYTKVSSGIYKSLLLLMLILTSTHYSSNQTCLLLFTQKTGVEFELVQLYLNLRFCSEEKGKQDKNRHLTTPLLIITP